MAEKEEGELEIDVSHGWVRIAKAREDDPQMTMRLAEIMITIDYEIAMSELDTEGIVFRRPGDAGFEDVSLPRYREKQTLLCSLVYCSVYRTSLSTRARSIPPDIGYRVSTICGTVVPGNSRSLYRERLGKKATHQKTNRMESRRKACRSR